MVPRTIKIFYQDRGHGFVLPGGIHFHSDVAECDPAALFLTSRLHQPCGSADNSGLVKVAFISSNVENVGLFPMSSLIAVHPV